MGKLYAWEFVSLDGVMESPEKWINEHTSKDVDDFIREENLAAESMVLGKNTYEAFITFWPDQQNNEFGFADKLNRMKKYVVSSTLKNAGWNNTTIIRNDPFDEIRKIKAESSDDIGMTGSAQLFQSLLDARLLDEIHLLVYPVVLGSGLKLFGDLPRSGLTLKETRAFSAGVVLMSYHVS